MIGRSHSQLCKKNSCSVKLQGGPLDHNSRKIPVENSWIIMLQNNSKCLLLGLYTNLDNMLIFGLCFALLFMKLSSRKGFYTRYCLVCYRNSRPEVFCKKGVLRNFAKFTGKHLCHSLYFNEVAGLPATFLKKWLWHRCFPVSFEKFLITPFFTEHLWWLLLLLNKIQTKHKKDEKTRIEICFLGQI